MVPVTYGKVANTRHSAKHCNGSVRRSPYAIVAGSKRLGTSTTRSEFILREAETLAKIHREQTAHLYDYGLDEQGKLFRTLAREEGMDMAGDYVLTPISKGKARTHESEVFHDKVKMFKKLPEPTVRCSARGGHNGGTKDKSVSSTVAPSPDIDNVSSMTGQIPLSRDGRHVTKISDTAYAKERAKFKLCMKRQLVRTGRAEWTPAEKKIERLRKAALRNSASA
jgi:hypothetical protein